ncbi:MAG: hypothetical protein QG623_347 [Patescibacteria group bacterium]|nr:hypothetical protein [Patescibacteria group bacterium]
MSNIEGNAGSTPNGGAHGGHFNHQQREDIAWNQYLDSRANQGGPTFRMPGWEVVTEVVETTKTVNNHSITYNGLRWLKGGPKTHALILAGSLTVQAVWHNWHNIPKVAQDAVEETQGVKDDIGDYFHDEHVSVEDIRFTAPVVEKVAVTVPGKEIQPIEGFCASPLGETSIDTECANKALDEVESLVASGYKLDSVQVEGMASDDYGPDGLSIPNLENNIYASARAEQLSTLVESRLGKNVETTFSEQILEENLAELIKESVVRFGYNSQDQVEKIYKNPDTRSSLPLGLKALMDIQIGQSAGTLYTFNLQSPDGERTKLVMVSPPTVEVDAQEYLDDGEPKDKNKDYHLDMWPLIPIIIPPLPSLRVEKTPRTETKIKLKKSLKRFDGQLPDTTWLEMSSEVLDELEANGGKVGKDAWRFTRKYMYLLAQDRVKQFQSVSFKDAKGKDSEIRAAFIDHVPSEATQESFYKILEQLAALEGGEIASKLGLIAVYPSKNVGPTASKKKIGMGIDDQYRSGILGVAIPVLGLVEMHMPEQPTEEQLHKMSAAWTLAHEVAGHFTDIKKKGVSIKKVSGSRRYASTNPWLDRANQMFSEFRQNGARWSVVRRIADKNSENSTEMKWETQTEPGIETQIPRVDGAIRVEKHGFPTQYSATQPGELWAELAAAVVTGEEIRFSESGIPKPNNPEGDFAEGYIPSKEMVDAFLKQTSGDPISNLGRNLQKGDLAFSSLGQFIKWAKDAGYPEDRIKLLAHTVGSLGSTATS